MLARHHAIVFGAVATLILI
jgi:hypothetical protein